MAYTEFSVMCIGMSRHMSVCATTLNCFLKYNSKHGCDSLTSQIKSKATQNNADKASLCRLNMRK